MSCTNKIPMSRATIGQVFRSACFMCKSVLLCPVLRAYIMTMHSFPARFLLLQLIQSNTNLVWPLASIELRAILLNPSLCNIAGGGRMLPHCFLHHRSLATVTLVILLCCWNTEQQFPSNTKTSSRQVSLTYWAVINAISACLVLIFCSWVDLTVGIWTMERVSCFVNHEFAMRKLFMLQRLHAWMTSQKTTPLIKYTTCLFPNFSASLKTRSSVQIQFRFEWSYAFRWMLLPELLTRRLEHVKSTDSAVCVYYL